MDEISVLEVRIMGEGALQSVPMNAFLNGANAVLVGEKVLQFKDAVELSTQKYRLRGLLFRCYGKEDLITAYSAG